MEANMETMRKAVSSEQFLGLTLFLLFLSVVFICGCKSKESYKKEIEQKGFQYSREAFLKEAQEGNKELIELFVKAGIDVNAKDTNGATALMYTAMVGKPEIVKLLIDNSANINASDVQGLTALGVASAAGNNEVVKLLLEKGADINVALSPLALALSKKKYEISKLLIEKGANVNVNAYGVPIPVLVSTVIDGRLDIAKLLIEKGADINAKLINPNDEKQDGKTALMIAVESNNIEAVKLLLEKGADIEAKDALGNTALLLAKKNNEIPKLLIEKGADVNIIMPVLKYTALKEASSQARNEYLPAAEKRKCEEVVDLLKRAGARE
jgi:ankyrin repeat protein